MEVESEKRPGEPRAAADDWQVPQRQSEGRGWADIKTTAADKTYTGNVGLSETNCPLESTIFTLRGFIHGVAMAFAMTGPSASCPAVVR